MKIKIQLLLLLIFTFFANFCAFADGLLEDDGNKIIETQENTKVEKKSNALSEKELLNYQYCGKDSDCMEVVNGCCQCLQGDKYVSIAKNRFESFHDKFQCTNVLCPKEDDSIKCEEGVVSCVNHRCTYFPAEL
jgi:hypothetical protein